MPVSGCLVGLVIASDTLDHPFVLQGAYKSLICANFLMPNAFARRWLGDLDCCQSVRNSQFSAVFTTPHERLAYHPYGHFGKAWAR